MTCTGGEIEPASPALQEDSRYALHDQREFHEAVKLNYILQCLCGPRPRSQQFQHQTRQHPRPISLAPPLATHPVPHQEGRLRPSFSGCFEMVFILCNRIKRQLLKCYLNEELETQKHMCVGLVAYDSLQPHGPQPTRLLCSWDSPGKNTGVGCHPLLQDIFPTQYRTCISCIAGRFFTTESLGKRLE